MFPDNFFSSYFNYYLLSPLEKVKNRIFYLCNLLIINMRYLMLLTLYTDFSLPYFMCKFLYISQLLQEIREWKSLFYCCTMFFVRSCTWSRSHLICSACWSSIAFWLLMTPINTSGLLLMLTVELLM